MQNLPGDAGPNHLVRDPLLRQPRVLVGGLLVDEVMHRRLMRGEIAGAFGEDAAGVIIRPAIGVEDDIAGLAVLGEPVARRAEAGAVSMELLESPWQRSDHGGGQQQCAPE